VSRSRNTKERIFNYLFKDEKNLTAYDNLLKQKYEAVFAKWLDDPYITDTEMRKYVMKKWGVTYTSAYQTINAVKQMLGNVSIAAKEWQRYTAVEMIKSGYTIIKEAKEKIDVLRGEGLIKAGLALCKITKLDKEDIELPPWDEIKPLNIEPTGDVSVLGMQKTENLNELQRRMRKKYGFITDAKIVND